MTSEQQIRALISGADPARETTIAPATATVTQLIARAEATTARPPRPALPRRRLVLVGGAVAVAAAVTAYAIPKQAVPGEQAVGPPEAEPMGQVVVPIAYEFDVDPQPAAKPLRDLAARITDAAYDGKTGRYAYRHAKFWPGGRLAGDGFEMAYAEEEEQWTAPDGSGRIRRKILGVEFPNEESRRYWERELLKGGLPPTHGETVEDIPATRPPGPSPTGGPSAPAENPDPAEAARPADPTRPPTEAANLAALLRAEHGAADAAKWTMELYRSYVVPRRVRVQVLLILSGLDGFVWRGAVTDRAGRPGVAITVTWTPPRDDTDGKRYEYALVFDPRTGELLAREATVLTPHRRPLDYELILGSDWTNELG